MISEPGQPPELLSLPVARRSLPELERLQVAARQVVAARQRGLAVTSLVEGDALLLGALQRAPVTLELAGLGELQVARRLTSGGAVRLQGSALHHLLLLPQVTWLVPDAHPGNFINRHVRGLLAGYNALGARAHYFGREHFTLAKRPAGVLGLDLTSHGVWILEAWVGVERSAALTEFRGAMPLALREALAAAGSARVDSPPLELAERVHERAVRSWLSAGPGATVYSIADAELSSAGATQGHPKTPDLEADAECDVWRSREVPIGLLEVGVAAGRRLIRGDMLTSCAAVAAAQAALAGLSAVDTAQAQQALTAFAEAPFEGARLSDLLELLVDDSEHG